MESYETLPGLAGYYLEDSYVLGIAETADELRLDLEAVLTESHPEYRPPKAGETYCYRRGGLVFAGFERVEWSARTDVEFTDASGEVDHGNIDVFRHDGEGYDLEGDWGRVRVVGGSCRIDLLSWRS